MRVQLRQTNLSTGRTSGGSRMSQTGAVNPKGGGTNLLFGQIFPESCMKMKEIAPR